MIIACYDCRFWSPGEEGDFHDESQKLPALWESESMPGECRCHPPALGELLRDSHGEEFRFFGQWPQTMAADWCGRFEPRPRTPRDPPEAPAENPRECHENA